MENLLILGGGGHGKVVASLALDLGRWDRIAILDDRYDGTQTLLGLPVLGKLEDAARFRGEFTDAFVAFGDNRLRRSVTGRVEALGYRLPVLVHPSASVSPRSWLDAGTVACVQSAVVPGARLGRGCILNTGASVCDGCVLEDFVHVSAGARLASGVLCGAGAWVGIGSIVRENVRLGRNAIIQPGSVILHDVPDDAIVAGQPGHPVPAGLRP